MPPTLLTPRRPSRVPHGFTLIEVLLIVALIGVLAAIALPMYTGYQDRARTRMAAQDMMKQLGVYNDWAFRKTMEQAQGADTPTLVDPAAGHDDREDGKPVAHPSLPASAAPSDPASTAASGHRPASGPQA